jgi:SAM-dependent methyltransferase
MYGEMHPTDPTAITIRDRLPQDKEALCLAAVVDTLGQMARSANNLPSHMQRYVDWMRSKASERGKPHSSLAEACSRLEDHDVESRLLARVARNLPNILSGDVDPLSLLFSDDILTQYYAEICETLFQQTAEYVDLLVHKNPQMRILEVGAGTGSATASVMTVLQHRFTEYVYTDISPSFFSKAKEKFPSPKMTFKTLDISSDPVQQGYDADTFDLIIAANVSIPRKIKRKSLRKLTNHEKGSACD